MRRNSKKIGFVSVAAPSLLVACAKGSTVVAIENGTPTNATNLDSGDSKGIGFTPAANFQVTALSLTLTSYFNDGSTPSDVVADIYTATSSGTYLGTLVGTLSDSSTTTLTSTATNYTFTSASNIDLTAGTNYWVYVQGNVATKFTWDSNTVGLGTYTGNVSNSGALPARYATGFTGANTLGSGPGAGEGYGASTTANLFSLQGNGSALTESASTITLRSMVGGSATASVTLTNSNATDAATFTAAQTSGTGLTVTPSGSVAASGSTPASIGFSSYATTGARSGVITFTNTANNADSFNSSGNTVTLSASSAVVANRVFNVDSSGTLAFGSVFNTYNSSINPAGGSSVGVTSTGGLTSYTTVKVNNATTVTGGVTVVGDGTTYNGTTTSGSLTVTGNFNGLSAGNVTGNVSLTNGNAALTGEGLSGESDSLAVPYSVSVYNHGAASFASGSLTTAAAINLRATQSNVTGATATVDTYNYQPASGQTDGINLTSISGSNAAFSLTGSASYSNQAAGGGGQAYTFALNNVVGLDQSQAYTYNYADAGSIAGGGSLAAITANVTGTVDALVEDTTVHAAGNATTASTSVFRSMDLTSGGGYTVESGGGLIGTVTVTKSSPGNYLPGIVTGINGGTGVNAGALQIDLAPSAASFGTDASVVLLDFVGITASTASAPTGLASLESDLRADGYDYVDQFGNSNGSFTSTLANFDTGSANYSLELLFEPGQGNGTTPSYFDFDFSKYTAQGLGNVVDIAVVPEPRSMGLLMTAGAGAFYRRKRTCKV